MNLPTSSLPDLAMRSGRFIALWVFGVATTLLLLGLWGHAVSTDEAGIERSLGAALATDDVVERMHGWLVDGIEDWTALSGAEATAAARAVMATPAAESAVADVISEAVDAAMAPPGSTRQIDVAGALAPVLPHLTTELARAGVETDPAILGSVLAQVEPIVISSDSAMSIVGFASAASGVLSLVVGVGLVALLVSGGFATYLADERWPMVRSLANRLVVSAVTFAVFLRLGAWALDPHRGRSPIAAGGAVLLRSNGGILLGVGLVAAIAAVTAFAVGRRRRVGGASSDDTPKAGEATAIEDDTPTGEQPQILVTV